MFLPTCFAVESKTFDWLDFIHLFLCIYNNSDNKIMLDTFNQEIIHALLLLKYFSVNRGQNQKPQDKIIV